MVLLHCFYWLFAFRMVIHPCYKKGLYDSIVYGEALSVKALKPSENEEERESRGASALASTIFGICSIILVALRFPFWRDFSQSPGDTKRSVCDSSFFGGTGFLF